MPGAEAGGAASPADESGAGESRLTVGVVAGGIVTLLVFLIAIRPAVDNDLWFHLRTARWMLDHHDWVGVDPFTHTRPGVTRVQTDWLSQLAYYGVWRIGGLTGVAVFMATAVAGSMALLYRTLPGSVRIRAGVVLLTAAASSIFWSARPQIITFVGTVAVSALLRVWRRAPAGRLIWWIVPVTAVWANAHGGVVYGVLIIGGTLAGEVVNRGIARRRPLGVVGVVPLPWPAIRRLALVAATSVTVLSVNPSGARIYGLPFHQVTASTQFVQEYRPPSVLDPTAAPFFLLLALTAALVVWRRRQVDAAEVLLLAGSAVFALQFTRSIPFFAVIAAPVVARHAWAVLGDRGDPAAAPAPTGLVVVAMVVAVLVVGLTTVRLDGDTVDARLSAAFPVGATQWIEANHPSGELFNTFDWGGYLMWEAPDRRVSIDGRTDVYDEYLDTYQATITARPGWEDELAREHVATVLVTPTDPLAAALETAPGWRLAYEDDVAVVFVRT